MLDLAGVLNDTFDRLHAAFDQLTRPHGRRLARAAHAPGRDPLAARWPCPGRGSAEAYRESIKTCLNAATRMTAIVEGLLTLARADAGKLDLRAEPIAFDHLVAEAAALVAPLAEGNRRASKSCWTLSR